jgi:CRISPR-associated helicase Cas3
MYAFETLIEQGFSTEEVLSVTTAILHHHTPFTRSRMDPEKVFDTDNCDKMVSNLTTVIDEMASFSGYFSSEVDVGRHIRSLKNSIKGIRGGRNSEFYDEFNVSYDRIAILSSLLHSALVQADHYVSAIESGGDSYIPSRISGDSVNLYPNLRPFQKSISDTSSEHLLGLAGCGEGKTHSAFQWGMKMVEKGEADRLVFAMPTQVTTNNLLLSIREDIVDNSDSTLYHGSSEDFLEERHSGGKEEWQSKELDEESRRWFKSPVTVCTVDHVLSSLVNGYKTANVARGNLLRSAVVFDEIHAYDGYTTGHILSALQKLDEMGVPWYVMTATMPKQLRDQRAFDSSEVVESEGRLEEGEEERNPFEISLSEEKLTAEEVLEQVEGTEAKKVMIVKNTVKSANEMAQRLDSLLDETGDDHEIVYYSSEFIQRDRKEKEEEIRDKFGVGTNPDERRFLISTQVCEISLDLSADLLLTDIAPMDALIQRAGRLHRKGREPDCNSCVCEQCNNYDQHRYDCVVYSELRDEETDRLYPYAESDDSEEWKILSQTHDVLREAETYSFKNSLKWMDEAYQEVDFHRMDMRTDEFARIMDEDLMYGKDRNLVEDNEDSDLTIRRINNRRISVLPCIYKRQRDDGEYISETAHRRWDNFHNCKKGVCGVLTEGYDECVEDLSKFMRRNTVPVPSWWMHKGDTNVTHLKYEENDVEEALVMDIEYYYRYGVIRPNASRSEQPDDVRGNNIL